MGNRFEIFGDVGFTLIELLVVILIIGILASVTFVAIDPLAQFQKSNNVRRQSDFKQVSTALDTYYNDYTFYPDRLDDSAFNTPTYLQSAFADPDSSTTTPYIYVVDNVSQNSPQWYVLFGKMENKPTNKTFCALENTGCVPADYKPLGYNLCVYGGNVDCSALQGMSISSN